MSVLLICFWRCTNPEPKARPWQSFIPKGYTVRDSVRGYLNLDSIPDMLLVFDSITEDPNKAPRRLLMLLYGSNKGQFEQAAMTFNALYDQHSGGVSGVEPYAGATINKGRFTIEQEGGMTHFRWNLLLRFALDSSEGNWYLDRSNYTTFNPEDTVPMRVTERVVVHDSHDFGKVLLQDFNIKSFEADEEDTSDTDDRVIPFNFFKMRPLTLPSKSGELDSIAALRTLFPGRFFRDFEYSEDANVVFWLCNECPKVQLDWFDTYGDEPEKTEFPDSFANFTKVLSTLSYEENGEPYKAVFFSTGFDYPGGGRIMPGVLGIAIFKKTGDSWQLVAFSPHVAAEGTFQTAHAPQTVLRAGRQNFFILDGGNANPAGAGYIYYNKFIFGVHQGLPMVLLYFPDASCIHMDSRLTHWKSEIEVLSEPIDFPDIKLITSGYFYDNNDNNEYNFWENIPWLKKQIQQHPGQDSFDFKVERRFRFNGKKYVPVL